jgi:hypothetical protein
MLADLLGGSEAAKAVFIGRVGHGAAARARSLRLPVDRLLVGDGPGPAQQGPQRPPG